LPRWLARRPAGHANGRRGRLPRRGRDQPERAALPQRHAACGPAGAGGGRPAAATADAELKRRFADTDDEATPAEPEELRERPLRERRTIRDLIRDTGISLG
jgi:hypothetical protein